VNYLQLLPLLPVFVIVGRNVVQNSPIDQRLQPVKANELVRLIQETPISSKQHAVLISRASKSKLTAIAYQQYKIIQTRMQKNPDANLYLGKAAFEYWRYMDSPAQYAVYGHSNYPNTIFTVARTAFNRATELAPNSAMAKAELGFFLWQWGNSMDKGLAMLMKASILAPNDARVHVLVGDLYSNPSTSSYKPQKAEQEMKKAVELDPTYAYPHFLLAGLYIRLRQYQSAENELKSYFNLAPPSTIEEEWAKRLQSEIDEGLHRKKKE
jgi:Flp pilus assembly protein TadD